MPPATTWTDGPLWTEFPSVGGPSDQVHLAIEPAEPAIFRMHSSTFSGEGLKWVAASGVIGASSISIPVESAGTWRIRLHFADPEAGAKPGDREMDVTLQGKKELQNLDIVKEAGAPQCALVKEFEIGSIGGKIVIGLTARGSLPTILSGVELLKK